MSPRGYAPTGRGESPTQEGASLDYGGRGSRDPGSIAKGKDGSRKEQLRFGRGGRVQRRVWRVRVSKEVRRDSLCTPENVKVTLQYLQGKGIRDRSRSACY